MPFRRVSKLGKKEKDADGKEKPEEKKSEKQLSLGNQALGAILVIVAIPIMIALGVWLTKKVIFEPVKDGMAVSVEPVARECPERKFLGSCFLPGDTSTVMVKSDTATKIPMPPMHNLFWIVGDCNSIVVTSEIVGPYNVVSFRAKPEVKEVKVFFILVKATTPEYRKCGDVPYSTAS